MANGIDVEGFDEMLESIKRADVNKDSVVCKAILPGSFKCFSRNEKPHIWLCSYPKMGRGYWRVTRNYAIQWKHLTMQEKDNLHAAYEYVKILNQRYEDKLNGNKD